MLRESWPKQSVCSVQTHFYLNIFSRLAFTDVKPTEDWVDIFLKMPIKVESREFGCHKTWVLSLPSSPMNSIFWIHCLISLGPGFLIYKNKEFDKILGLKIYHSVSLALNPVWYPERICISVLDSTQPNLLYNPSPICSYLKNASVESCWGLFYLHISWT